LTKLFNDPQELASTKKWVSLLNKPSFGKRSRRRGLGNPLVMVQGTKKKPETKNWDAILFRHAFRFDEEEKN